MMKTVVGQSEIRHCTHLHISMLKTNGLMRLLVNGYVIAAKVVHLKCIDFLCSFTLAIGLSIFREEGKYISREKRTLGQTSGHLLRILNVETSFNFRTK